MDRRDARRRDIGPTGSIGTPQNRRAWDARYRAPSTGLQPGVSVRDRDRAIRTRSGPRPARSSAASKRRKLCSDYRSVSGSRAVAFDRCVRRHVCCSVRLAPCALRHCCLFALVSCAGPNGPTSILKRLNGASSQARQKLIILSHFHARPWRSFADLHPLTGHLRFVFPGGRDHHRAMSEAAVNAAYGAWGTTPGKNHRTRLSRDGSNHLGGRTSHQA